jgi:hypothetical protein
MRKERSERKAAEERPSLHERGDSDFSLSEEKIEMDSWESVRPPLLLSSTTPAHSLLRVAGAAPAEERQWSQGSSRR